MLLKHNYVYATPYSIRKYPVVTLLQDLGERILRKGDYELYTKIRILHKHCKYLATAAQNVIL